MIPLWIALIIGFLVWVIIAILYAEQLEKMQMYKDILADKDWDKNEDINRQIKEYGVWKLALDLIMISPLVLVILIKR
jgi:hypothetical protein|tara:strand:- start:740 stop:973 length:234 start_codon:yes stop_codon:yes gene_type:complete